MVISVEIISGAPAVVAVSAPRTSVEIGDFTVTDNGVGDTTITWPARMFPQEVARPELSINEDIGEMVGGTVVPVTNGVRSAPTAPPARDLHFTVTRR